MRVGFYRMPWGSLLTKIASLCVQYYYDEKGEASNKKTISPVCEQEHRKEKTEDKNTVTAEKNIPGREKTVGGLQLSLSLNCTTISNGFLFPASKHWRRNAEKVSHVLITNAGMMWRLRRHSRIANVLCRTW